MLNSRSYLNKTNHAINNIIMFELTAVPQKLWDFGGIYIPKKRKTCPSKWTMLVSPDSHAYVEI